MLNLETIMDLCKRYNHLAPCLQEQLDAVLDGQELNADNFNPNSQCEIEGFLQSIVSVAAEEDNEALVDECEEAIERMDEVHEE
jgi:hypothetical protein